MQQRQVPFSFIYPWRVEGRQTAFHPYVTLSNQRHLNQAITESTRQKELCRFYSTRVRPN